MKCAYCGKEVDTDRYILVDSKDHNSGRYEYHYTLMYKDGDGNNVAVTYPFSIYQSLIFCNTQCATDYISLAIHDWEPTL